MEKIEHLKPTLIEMIQTHPNYNDKYKKVLIEHLETSIEDLMEKANNINFIGDMHKRPRVQ